MKNKPTEYVIFIVPERHHRVRRMRVTKRMVTQVLTCSILAMMGFTFFLVHYAYTVTQARRAPELFAQNVAMGVRLAGIQADIDRLNTALNRIDATAMRVRAITQLNDPARNLALGPLRREPAAKGTPVLYVQGERIDAEDEVMDTTLALRLVEEGLDANRDHVAQTAQTINDLSAYFNERPSLLATTPSVRPVQSRWITSHFGPRKDPFTGLEVMHKGIDFLADLGSDVYAPADGRVIFGGARGAGYGETLVLDHGFGVQTLFAHLSELHVAPGALVQRGQRIAAVGHSGRTTGAHLHYEVRFNGLPYDPERFILDDD
jgi:murein DD-endopeptidase MepM/ murein hydrolase activator NlpD